MDITDFQNTKKYHAIIPFMYILSWVTMITGPLYYPVWYMNFYMILMIYLIYKAAWFPITMVIIFIQSWGHMNRLKNAEQGKSYQSLVARVDEEVNYAFIIPNYKQQVQVIQQTLDLLASHKRAKASYLVFLAMEAHQEGSDIKAKTLLKKYEGQFRVMDFSHHKIRQYQQKGKASNVSWCAQNLQPIFQKNAINPDSVMLTIIDVDSWVPDLYMDTVDKLVNQEYEQRHSKIFQPIQIFTRNHLDVPVVTRVYDIIHSSVHMMNLYSPRNVTFSLSNYTLSYNLVKRVGFWDTVPEAIGEDFHMVFKAHFKTNFQITPTPIYIPFNQLNISTGNGYWADCKARFWQAQRHAKGIADMAYCLKRWFQNPCSFKAFALFWFVFEAFCLGSVVPWISFSTFLQQHLLGLASLNYIYPIVFIKYFIVLFTLFGWISYILYEIMKRRANKVIYKRQNESLWRMLEYLILSMPLFIIIGIPTFLIAGWNTFRGRSQYVVADKKLKKSSSTQQK